MTPDADVSANEPAETEVRHMSVDRRLRILIGDPLPAGEFEMWTAMSADQRKTAMRRMKAVARWVASRPPHDAKIWADRAGITVTRLYEMAKAWRRSRSLAIVEVSADAPRKRAGAYDSVILEEAGPVIDRAPEGKKDNVRYLAMELGKVLEEKSDAKPPSYITLRRKVEDELRLRARKTRPGSHVQFDCCAVSMATLDRKQQTMFFVVDVQTQLVLGEAVGHAADSRQGYALAATTALHRLRSGSFSDIAWSDRLAAMEFVAGADWKKMLKMPVELIRIGVEANVQVATERFGRYLRKIIGDRMGRLLLLSAAATRSTYDGGADRSDVGDDDLARIRIEVEVHNASRLTNLERAKDYSPPDDLITTLEYFASWSAD